MRKSYKKDEGEIINGFTPVKMKPNFITPCEVCGKKPQLIYYKLEKKNGTRSVIRCLEHATK